jgi:3-phosphoshikimate 1-carboxyvinyltransferase
VTVEDGPDWWSVEGRGATGVEGGALGKSHLDHRIAMSFLILGMAARQPVRVDDGGPIATSFPVFETLMHELGGDISVVDAAAAAQGAA